MLPKAGPPSEDKLGLERIVFFSDAVMAIAITLLALDIHVPELGAAVGSQQLAAALKALAPRFMTFFISFVVIGLYWLSHHRYFGYIQRYDTRLMLFNLLFLFFIICMPFLAGLLGQYVAVPVALVAYTLAIAALGVSMALIWWYASHDHRLIAPDVDAATIRVINLRLFVAPVMFLLAVPFAYVSSTAVIFIWWLSPLAVLLATRLWGGRMPVRRARRA
jgi:TMEM175 potassium channel family protein